MGKDYYANSNHKRAGVAIIISDRIDHRTKKNVTDEND